MLAYLVGRHFKALVVLFVLAVVAVMIASQVFGDAGLDRLQGKPFTVGAPSN